MRDYGVQAGRLISILRALSEPRCLRSIADKCDMSERTAYRYLEVLKREEVPIIRQKGKYFIPPTTTITNL